MRRISAQVAFYSTKCETVVCVTYRPPQFSRVSQPTEQDKQEETKKTLWQPTKHQSEWLSPTAASTGVSCPADGSASGVNDTKFLLIKNNITVDLFSNRKPSLVVFEIDFKQAFKTILYSG